MDLRSVDDVLKSVRKNRFRVWSGDKPETYAARAKAGGFVRLAHTPKFTVGRQDAIFTLGSCFARNVEKVLVARGFDVLSAGFSLPKEVYFDNPALAKDASAGHSGALNKYSVATIRGEIDRALGRLGPIPLDGLIEVEPGLFFDPQASGVKPNALEAVRNARARIQAVNARIVEADVVLVTLGTTETWFDTVTGLALNFKPWPALMRAMPERFAFADADAADVIDGLEAVIATLRSACRPGLRVVLTVSPVPMGSTWTDADVVTANTHSKAALRAAAAVLARRHADVDYFPHYETVLASAREIAFAADGVHVHPAMTAFVTEGFAGLYAAPPPSGAAAATG